MFPAGGEHGDRRVLLGRGLHAAALPGPLSVDERPAAVSQPVPAGEAQVHVNHGHPECTRAGPARGRRRTGPRCNARREDLGDFGRLFLTSAQSFVTLWVRSSNVFTVQ